MNSSSIVLNQVQVHLRRVVFRLDSESSFQSSPVLEPPENEIEKWYKWYIFEYFKTSLQNFRGVKYSNKFSI